MDWVPFSSDSYFNLFSSENEKIRPKCQKGYTHPKDAKEAGKNYPVLFRSDSDSTFPRFEKYE